MLLFKFKSGSFNQENLFAKEKIVRILNLMNLLLILMIGKNCKMNRLWKIFVFKFLLRFLKMLKRKIVICDKMLVN